MATSSIMQIIITVNSHSEISTWLFPFVTTLKEEMSGVRLCVAILPCVLA